MGAFAPSPLVTPAVTQDVIDRVVMPVLDGMRAEGTPYAGFLYVGLMLTAAGPKVIEFNVRFGDPEAQVVLPMLESRLCRPADGGRDRHARPAGPCASGRNRTCAWSWRRRGIPIRRAPDNRSTGSTPRWPSPARWSFTRARPSATAGS